MSEESKWQSHLELLGDSQQMEKLKAENKRLREVLQNVVNTGQSPLPSRRKAKEMTVIALEGLEGAGK